MVRCLPIRTLTALLVALTLGACEAAPPTAPTSLDGGHQATVERGQTITFLVHLDEEAELMSVHAPSTVCAGGALNVADFQLVTTESAVGQFIAQIKDRDERVAVYHATSFADAGMTGAFALGGFANIVNVGTFCGFLQSPALVAEGIVRRISNLSNGNFSANWTGTLEGPGGERYRLREIYQLTAATADPLDQDQWSLNVSSIRLNAGR